MTPTDRLTQPAERAVHAVNNARQIALVLGTFGALETASIEENQATCARLVELLSAVPADIAALQQHIERLQEDLRGLRDQGLEDARTISAERERNEGLNRALSDSNTRLAVASRDVEQLLQTVSIRLQGETADFNRIRRLRDLLDLSNQVEDHEDHGGYTLIVDERRTAAAGGR